MANKLIAFTLVGTGTRDIVGFGFSPNDLEFYSGAKNLTGAQVSISRGQVDSDGNCFYKTDYCIPAAFFQAGNSDRLFYIREYNGSSWVEVLVFSFVSYITDGFRINVLTNNGGHQYQIRGKARLT